jgi:predicted nucleotide-binding protein
MAKRSSSNSRPTVPPSVTPKQGIELLKRQQQRARELLEKRPVQKTDYENWCNTTIGFLVKCFGSDSDIEFAVMHSDGMRLSLGRESEAYLEQERAERLANKSARLTSAIEQLEVEGEVELKPIPAAVPHFEATGRKVFLVHGRDTGPRESCARFLSQLGLEVVILHEQPDQGQTVIEKFEKHANVRFAVVLLTADDRGGERNIQFDGQKPRARQNVIFELGFFLGRLGRSRVCALYEEGVELPSDYHGVIYVPIDGGEAWKLRLAKELKAAGLEVNMNKAV